MTVNAVRQSATVPCRRILHLISRSDTFPLLSVVVLLFLVYSPVFQYVYLYHDDWVHHFGRPFDCSSFPAARRFVTLGRPVGGLITCSYFSLFRKIEDAREVRFVMVVLIAVLVAMIYKFLRQERIPSYLASFLAFGIGILPGTLTFGFYLGSSFILFSLLAASVAALGCQYTDDAKKVTRYAVLSVAILLEIMACLIYQTGAMLFWLFVAISAARNFDTDLSLMIRRLGRYIFVGATSMILYFIWYQLSGNLSELAVADPTRGRIFSHITITMRWFFTGALPRAADLWSVDDRGLAVPIVVGAISVATLVYFLVKRLYVAEGKITLGKIIVTILYIVLLTGFGAACFAPMLASEFRYEAFRTLVPLSAFILVMPLIHTWLAISPKRPNIRWLGSLSLLASAIIAIHANHVILRNMVLGSHAELETYRQILGGVVGSNSQQNPVHVIVPRIGNHQNDEINTFSSNFVEDIPFIVNTIRGDYGLPGVKITNSISGQKISISKNTIVIDLTPLANADIIKYAHVESNAARRSIR